MPKSQIGGGGAKSKSKKKPTPVPRSDRDARIWAASVNRFVPEPLVPKPRGGRDFRSADLSGKPVVVVPTKKTFAAQPPLWQRRDKFIETRKRTRARLADQSAVDRAAALRLRRLETPTERYARTPSLPPSTRVGGGLRPVPAHTVDYGKEPSTLDLIGGLARAAGHAALEPVLGAAWGGGQPRGALAPGSPAARGALMGGGAVGKGIEQGAIYGTVGPDLLNAVTGKEFSKAGLAVDLAAIAPVGKGVGLAATVGLRGVKRAQEFTRLMQEGQGIAEAARAAAKVRGPEIKSTLARSALSDVLPTLRKNPARKEMYAEIDAAVAAKQMTRAQADKLKRTLDAAAAEHADALAREMPDSVPLKQRRIERANDWYHEVAGAKRGGATRAVADEAAPARAELAAHGKPSARVSEADVQRITDELMGHVTPRRTKFGKNPRAFIEQGVRNYVRHAETALEHAPEAPLWYSASSRRVLQATGGNLEEAEKILQLIGIYSPQQEVVPNLGAALKAYRQWKAGEPIKVNALHDGKARDVLEGRVWEGRKTNNFYRDLLHDMWPERYQQLVREGAIDDVTVDRHMYTAAGLGENDNTYYDYVQDLTRKLGDSYGLTPREMQATVWVSRKAELLMAKGKSPEAAWAAAKTTYKDALEREVYTTRLPVEARPGDPSVLPDYDNWTPGQKLAHLVAKLPAVERYFANVGVPFTMRSVGKGFWVTAEGTLEVNPAVAVDLHTGIAYSIASAREALKKGEEYGLSAAERALYDNVVLGLGHGMNQAAGSWFRPLLSLNQAGNTLAKVTLGHAATGEEMTKLAQAYKGTATWFSHAEDGVYVVHGGDDLPLADFRNTLDEVFPDPEVGVQWFSHDSNYLGDIENGYTQARDSGGLGDVADAADQLRRESDAVDAAFRADPAAAARGVRDDSDAWLGTAQRVLGRDELRATERWRMEPSSWEATDEFGNPQPSLRFATGPPGERPVARATARAPLSYEELAASDEGRRYLNLANKDTPLSPSEWEEMSRLEEQLGLKGAPWTAAKPTPIEALDVEQALMNAPRISDQPARVTLIDGSTHAVNPEHPISLDGETVHLLDGSSVEARTVTHVEAGDGTALAGERLPPAEPPRPPASPAAEAPLPPEPVAPGEQLMKGMGEATRLRREQQALRSEEASRRAAEVARILESTPGEAGYAAARQALRGDLPKLSWDRFTEMDSEAVDAMVRHVRDHPSLQNRPYDMLNTEGAIYRILNGHVPRRYEQRLLRNVFGPDVADQLKASVPIWKRLYDGGISLINLPRTLMSSFDLSAPFRQGLMFGISHPRMFFRNFRWMFKAAGSKNAYAQILQEIQGRPTFDLMQRGKVAFTDLGTDLTHREEQFMSHFADHVPGVGMSQRAYVAFLNKSRADYFDWLVDRVQKLRPDLDLESPEGEKVLKSFGRLVNTATGRGGYGDTLNKAMPAASAVFFAPRLVKSRLDLINPLYYGKLDPIARKEAFKQAAGLATVVAGLGSLATLAGAKVEKDPRNANWGKIRIGNTRFDIAGGFQQPLRTLAQIASGQIISSTTGKKMQLAGGFGELSRKDILQRFIESKFSPPASLVNDLLKGTDFEGEPLDVKKAIAERLIPLLMQDAYAMYEEGGNLPAALAIYGIGMWGIGSQTYGTKPPKRRTRTQSPFGSGGGGSILGGGGGGGGILSGSSGGGNILGSP